MKTFNEDLGNEASIFNRVHICDVQVFTEHGVYFHDFVVVAAQGTLCTLYKAELNPDGTSYKFIPSEVYYQPARIKFTEPIGSIIPYVAPVPQPEAAAANTLN